MLIRIYNKRTNVKLADFNVLNETNYKKGDLISVPELESVENNILKLNNNKTYYLSNNFFICDIVHAFTMDVDINNSSKISQVKGCLKIYVEDLRTFKLKQILKLC